MRIISVRLKPIAGILSIVYAVFGLGYFMIFAIGSSAYLTLPFGVLAPLFYLNLNLNLPRSGGIPYNLFLCVACVVSYAITGGITGAAVAGSFNFVAKKMGGIDAKYFTIEPAPPLTPR